MLLKHVHIFGAVAIQLDLPTIGIHVCPRASGISQTWKAQEKWGDGDWEKDRLIPEGHQGSVTSTWH